MLPNKHEVVKRHYRNELIHVVLSLKIQFQTFNDKKGITNEVQTKRGKLHKVLTKRRKLNNLNESKARSQSQT